MRERLNPLYCITHETAPSSVRLVESEQSCSGNTEWQESITPAISFLNVFVLVISDKSQSYSDFLEGIEEGLVQKSLRLLTLIASLPSLVCVSPSVLHCLNDLFMLQSQQGFSGSCYFLPAPPKVWTLCFSYVPSMAPCALVVCFSDFSLTVPLKKLFYYYFVRDKWHAKYCYLSKPGCSLTLLLGLVSVSEGIFKKSLRKGHGVGVGG